MSSPLSFQTAREDNLLTSPLPWDSNGPHTDNTPLLPTYPKPSASFYRPAKDITYELRNHATVHLEHGQYLQAIHHLTVLLEAGGSVSTPQRPLQAFLPPPQLLALAATLVIHPSMTTRTFSADKIKASNAALFYLHKVNKIIGPVNARFGAAFVFSATKDGSRRIGRRKGLANGGDSPGSDEDDRVIKSRLANAGSLWTQGENFWQVIGWAFNCSVTWAKRWERWKLWLDFILEVLEDDWEERKRLQNAKKNDTDQEDDNDVLLESLIWQYLASINADSRTSRRKILRAVLADGDPKAMNEFKEVFKNETAEPVQKDDTFGKERKELNIEEGDFGDYESDEEEDEEDDMEADPATTRQSRSQKTAATAPSASSDRKNNVSGVSSEDEDEDLTGERDTVKPSGPKLGGIDSIVLRQRILTLLANVAASLPKQFTRLSDVFDLYTEALRPLPTSIFHSLLLTLRLAQDHQIMLFTTLLLPFQSGQLPAYDLIIPTQADLETYYLPLTANSNSTSDNAKVSLVIEMLVLRMLDIKELDINAQLRSKVQAGIKARDEKAIGDARRKGKGRAREEKDRKALDASAMRLRFLVGIKVAAPNFDSPQSPAIETDLASSPLSDALSIPLSDEDDIIMDAALS